jgi:putative NIF3 family GTP cyclohydrolase 1 type 2
MAGNVRLTRRDFGALAASVPLAFGAPLKLRRTGPRAESITAATVAERIRAGIGIEWKPGTVDGFKAGDPGMAVTGIVTTSMATLAVLQDAVKAGANVVITHEPTFFAGNDARQPPPARGGFQTAPPPGSAPPDPVYAAKNAFIERHGLVVFRLRDQWRARTPNPFAEGLGAALGWRNHQAGADPARYEIPVVTLSATVTHVKTALGTRGGLRVIGDPAASIRQVALLPGSTPITAALELLPSVDAIIAGEVREWETVEYARDAIDSDRARGLILVGRVVSEEPGMRALAAWLETVVPEVRVRHIAVGDPYWRPS